MRIYAHLLISLLLCVTVFCASVFADGFDIVSVDFYPAGAKLTFQVQSDGQFAFDLPGAFDFNSVRCLSMERLTSVKVETVYIGNEAQPELDAAQARLDAAARALGLLDGRKLSLEQTRAILQAAYSPGQRGNWSVVSSADGVADYAARAERMRVAAEAALTDIAIERPHAQKNFDEAAREYQDLERILTEKRGINSETAVKVRGATDGNASLTFEAFTPHAGWTVGYEMELDSKSGVIDAVMNARAWQRTGMELDGAFTFRTRAPSQSVYPPKVSPLTVGLREKVPYMAGIPGTTSNMPGYFPKMMAEDRTLEERAPAPAPRQTTTLTDVSITGSGRIDGDGSQVRIKLGEFSVESTPVLIVIPEQNSEAWVVASVDVIPESLLPGEAELSVDGASSGRAYIQESAASARIPFGMSRRVLSKKTPMIAESGSSWTGSGTFNDGYTLEVANGTDTEREITVIDRAPVSTVDKVTVTLDETDPKAERDDEGILTWKLTLAPGETKKITVRYTIKYPGGETLDYNYKY
ncbi:MAG: DUF4139 domain-containing protein [Synergistaceae bacterium]|nr:DUF4139 domain-containing protein [Synergistaceae bacterium]